MEPLRLAYVWHDAVERSVVARLLDGSPEWRVTYIHALAATRIDDALSLMKGGLDGVLIHLSAPPGVALTLAELFHRERLRTRVVLMSRTRADKNTLLALFAGHVHPQNDLARLPDLLRSALTGEVAHVDDDRDLERRIVAVFNADSVVRAQFERRFGELYRGEFTIDDYRRFTRAFLVEDSMEALRPAAAPVFISHSSPDRELARELKADLAAVGVESFLSMLDVDSGAAWDDAVRTAIQGCREVLVLLTPHSKGRPWVLVEVGAAWVLQKRVTPCVAYIDVADVPPPLAQRQARPVVTKSERTDLVREIARRLGGATGVPATPPA